MLCSLVINMLYLDCYILGRSCSHYAVGFGRHAFSPPVEAAQLGSQECKKCRCKGKHNLAY